MSELRTNLAAIDTFQQRENIAQFHAPIVHTGQTAGKELGFHIGRIETEVVKLQNAWYAPFHKPQGIQISDLVSAKTVDLYEP